MSAAKDGNPLGNQSEQSGATTRINGDEQHESDESTADSRSEASSRSSGSSLATSALIRTTHVKTLIAEVPQASEPSLEMPREKQPPSPKSPSDLSSSSSSSKRYKFSLTNRYLTMPDVGDQQDAKYYQKELTKLEERERKRRRALNVGGRGKSGVGDVRKLQTPMGDNQTLNIEVNRTARTRENEDSDDCDLSVMGPSSPGSNLSSLMTQPGPDDWVQSQQIINGNSSSESVQATRVPPAHNHEHFQNAPSNEVANKTAINIERLVPAGDAGLDAAKCNSKAASDCFLPAGSSYLHHQSGPLAARKLVNSASSGIITPRAHHQDHNCFHDRHHQHFDESSECASNSLLVRFSSIMYATFLVILGCILHVSELRQKSRNSSDHIYTTVVALLGILWLVFLQMDLQRYKRYASKYILLESIFNDQQRAANRSSGNLLLDPTTRSTTSSSASLVNDRMSMNTEVIFKKTAYKMYQQRAAAFKPTNSGPTLDGHRHHKKPPPPGHHYDDSASTSSRMTANQSGSTLVPAYKFLHGKMGANFYLKCGMAAFCFGHVIHEGLRFGQQVYFFATANTHCRDSAALVAHLVTPLYSFYQLFMMFKYSNLVINRHKILAKFGLMHIIGTCVTFWFRTILEEAFEDFVHKMDYFKAQNRPINEFLDPTSSFRDNSHHASAMFATPTTINNDAPLRSWLSSMVSLTAATNTASGESPFHQSLSSLTLANETQATNQQVPPVMQNVSLAQSALFALMSSPISASISPQLVRHIPDSYHCAQNTLLTTKSMNALPYLYPFTIEYNLLIAATFLSLYFNIGRVGAPPAARCCQNKNNNHNHNKPHIRTHHSQDLSSGASKVYLSGRNINKQPSLMSGGISCSAGSHYGAEFSDNNNSASILQRYSSGELNNITAPSSHFGHLSRSGSLSKSHHLGASHLGEYKSNFVVNADCHAANKGLFLGFFVLLVTLVTIVIFFVTINKPSHLQLGIKINLIQEATLTSLILIVTLAGYRQIMRLNKNPHIRDKVTTDDVLMLIPLPFFFIHSLLSFRAETATLYAPSHLTKTLLHQQVLMSNTAAGTTPRSQPQFQSISLPASVGVGSNALLNSTNATRILSQHQQQSQPPPPNLSPKIDHYKLLTIALNLAVMVEVLVQTNFIIDGLRRCSESRYLRFKKPGRELITFAILLNITYWIVATFETKSVEQYKTEIEYYGPLPYMFISHTTLPVMLFYRYHSSVCLAEIWNRAYKSPKMR